MSTVQVNTIYPLAGTIVEIPTGYNLSLGGTIVSATSMLPSPVGQSGKYLVSNGTTTTWQSIGPQSMQVFTSSSTWYRPAGVARILVRLTGGGGGGSGHGEGGGAGGYAEKVIDVTSISSVGITIGGGGGGSYYANAAGAGGATSFGAYLSATGGNGANSSHQHCGGLPGLGSGGDINIYGGGGSGHEYYSGSQSGGTFFGGAAATGHPNGGSFAVNHQYRCAPGAGGSPGYMQSYQGCQGKEGIIVIWEFA
jgi:hypothetical protein